MAAAQYKSSNVSEIEPNAIKSQTLSASLPLDSTVICSTINKANSVGNGQASQTSQPNYHTKLKRPGSPDIQKKIKILIKWKIQGILYQKLLSHVLST